MRAPLTLVRFGSDPSELENPASLADTQAAKQSLSSNVMVSICPIKPKQQRRTITAGSIFFFLKKKAHRVRAGTHPSFQINGEPVWHVDHLESLFNLLVKLHLPQVLPLASLEVKYEMSSPPPGD